MQVTAVTHMHNKATEEIAKQQLQLDYAKLRETMRQNQRTINLEYDKLAETQKKNLNDYSAQLIRLAEERNHNRITEAQAAAELKALNQRFANEQYIKLYQANLEAGKVTITGPFKTGFTFNPGVAGFTPEEVTKYVLTNGGIDFSGAIDGYNPGQTVTQGTQTSSYSYNKNQQYSDKISRLQAKIAHEQDPKVIRNYEGQIKKLEQKLDRQAVNEEAEVTKEEAYENAQKQITGSQVLSNGSWSQDSQRQGDSEQVGRDPNRDYSNKSEQSGSYAGSSKSSGSKIIYHGGRKEEYGPGIG